MCGKICVGVVGMTDFLYLCRGFGFGLGRGGILYRCGENWELYYVCLGDDVYNK